MKNAEKKSKERTTSDESLNTAMLRIGKNIASTRKKCGLTQAKVAESLGVSDSTISRIERGECMPKHNLLHHMFMLFDIPPDDAIHMLFGSGNYREDNLFNDLRVAIREEKHSELPELLAQINKKNLISLGMYRQLYLYAQSLMEPASDVHIAVNELITALSITKKNFNLDCVSGYFLRFDELTIINGIGKLYLNAGEFDKAVKVFLSIVKNLDTRCHNERLKCEMYIGVLYNLSICYGMLGRHQEAEQVCLKAKTLGFKYNRLLLLPYLLNNIGEAKLQQGDIKGGAEIIRQAYHAALTMENQTLADFIKINAEKDHGINF